MFEFSQIASLVNFELTLDGKSGFTTKIWVIRT